VARPEQFGFTVVSDRTLQVMRDEAVTAKLLVMVMGNTSFLFTGSDELLACEQMLIRIDQRFPNIEPSILWPRIPRQDIATRFRALAEEANKDAIAPLVEVGIVAMVFDAVTIKGDCHLPISVTSATAGVEPWLMEIASHFAGDRPAYQRSLRDATCVGDALTLGAAGWTCDGLG
jgi:hypothetical protein